MANKTAPWSDDQLKKAARDIRWEVAMFCHAGLALVDGGLATDSVEYCAYLESFVVHFRGLGEFFHPRDEWPGSSSKNHSTDVLARRFDLNWKASGDLDWLRSNIRDADKRLAHITLDRQGAEKRWEVGKLKGEIYRLFQELTGNLAPNYLADCLPIFQDTPVQGQLMASTSSGVNLLIIPSWLARKRATKCAHP